MTSDWMAVSSSLERESPVFIVGIPRSGTSVLRFTLARLPTFRGKDEKAAETFAFVRPESIASILEPEGRRLLRYYFGDRFEAEALLAALANIPAAAIVEAGDRARSSRDREDAWRAAQHHHRLRLFFHFAARARGVKRLLEKTPTHVHYVPEIRATFPRAKFLFCLRHPIETFASFRKRLAAEEQRGRKEHRLEWLKVSVGRFCGDFNKVVRDIEAAQAEDPSCGIVVDYAALTRDPRSTLRSVCEAIAEPFDEAALFGHADEVRTSDGTPQPEGRVVRNESDWRKHMTGEEARDIESRLGAIYERYGYARLT